jgi:Ca-activated chloride channel family protein
MNQNLKRVEDKLRSERLPEPPPELIGLIKNEIPEQTGTAASGPAGTSSGTRGGLLLAASIVATVVGLSVVYRVSQPGAYSEAFQTAEVLTVETDELVVAEPDGREVRESPIPAPAEVQPTPIEVKEAPISRIGEAGEVVADLANEPAATPSKLSDQALVETVEATPAPRPAPMPVDRSESSRELMEESLAQFDVAPQATRERSPVSTPPAVMSQLRALKVAPGRQNSELGVVAPSTGGTAEPNDQPYGDMFFHSEGVNPFVDTEDDALSTFGLDVDTGSYTVARSYLERGHLPPEESIRVEEFVNYFDYGDTPPRRGDFALSAEVAPTPFGENARYQLMRVAIRGREIEADERQPATLVFVVDVSGSMAREDRLGLVKKSLFLMLDQLRPDDRVGLVVYGSQGRVLLEPTGNLEAIRSAIDRLQSEGATNAEEGLVMAYDLAEEFFRPGSVHRIILCSDGVANVGRTGPDSILERIGEGGERGIELSTIGFGMGNYNDVLMEQLADRGDGMYAYVDGLSEARRVFVENLTGMLQTIASEARAQVEFNPEVVERYRLLGYENRDIADERFRDDTVDAGEIGAGHSVTALYEVKLAEDVAPRGVLATVRLRYFSKEKEEFLELEQPVRVREIASDWNEASVGLRLASVVAEFAEILRGSYWAREGDMHDVFLKAQGLSGERRGDHELADFVSLVGRADRLVEATNPD